MDTAISPSPSPAPLPKPTIGIARSIAFCAIFYGVVIAVNIALYLRERSGELPLNMFSSALIYQVIAWPLILWIAQRSAGVSFREACPLRPFPVRLVPALLLASFGATILLLEGAGWIPMPDAFRKYLIEQRAASNELMVFFTLVVVAPVAEELFFRGQVLRGYLGRYTVTKSVWASAVMFAVFHLNPWQAVIALPLGVGYAWLVLRTGSLVPGILSHAMVNFSANFLLMPLASALGYNAEQLEAMEHFPPSILVFGGMTAAIGGFVLWRQLASATQPAPPTSPSR